MVIILDYFPIRDMQKVLDAPPDPITGLHVVKYELEALQGPVEHWLRGYFSIDSGVEAEARAYFSGRQDPELFKGVMGGMVGRVSFVAMQPNITALDTLLVGVIPEGEVTPNWCVVTSRRKFGDIAC
jgi:hypothetical protein